MSRPGDPASGTVVADRYQVDRLIARGGMAAVYLATHVNLNRLVALKVLTPPPDAEDPATFEERFQLEAETLASLDHPNIVTLHDFGEMDDGRFFLAMEYVEGPRLSDMLRQGPLAAEHALSLLIQVCAGLRYAHKHGVIHRDLKPSNLLIRTCVDGEEQVKVVDFGLVKLTETDQSITRAGLILGSPHCMAPEQVKGLDVDHRADIYAIGVLMFRSITGQYPFHGSNSAATMIAHLNQPVPTFFSVTPELVAPEGLEEIVRRCLQKPPSERYQSMGELMDDLATCMALPAEQYRSVSQSHSTLMREVEPPPPRRRRTGLLVAAVASVLVLLLLVGVTAVAIWWLVFNNPIRAQDVPEAVEIPVAEEPAPIELVDAPPMEEEALPSEDEPLEDEEPGEADPIREPAPPPVTVAPPSEPRTQPASQPPPEPSVPEPTAPDEPEEEEAPEGYMGLPDDLFGE